MFAVHIAIGPPESPHKMIRQLKIFPDRPKTDAQGSARELWPAGNNVALLTPTASKGVIKSS